MTPRKANTRTAATLVELLVVMSIIAALGAIALMMLPSVANSDATLKGTAEVQSALKISQAMAASARLPRGVRLLNTNGNGLCTEMQYIESPPVMVANPSALVAGAGDTTYAQTQPRVEFSYEFAPSGSTNPPAGTITKRHCYIYNLNGDQSSQVAPGATLVLPTLGAWARINSSLSGNEVTLEVYPDAQLGAANQDKYVAPPTAMYRTYHFGVYGPPVPLLGEPTVPLPQNIAIDLNVSAPQGPVGQNYDILFAPSGQLLVTPTNPSISPSSAVFLWVRDYTKVPSMALSGAAYANAFRLGGEQMIVGVRNGFVGTAPVLWPDASGNYASGNDAYTPARQQLN